MRVAVGVLGALFVFACAAVAQGEAEKNRLEAEKIERKEILTRRMAEATWLAAVCRDYKFTSLGNDFNANVDLTRSTDLYLEYRSRKEQPTQPSACSELLTKYGPEGSLEQGWVVKR